MGRYRGVAALALAAVLAACTSTPDRSETPTSVESATGTDSSAEPWAPGDPFPTDAFSDITTDPVLEEVAEKFEAALSGMAGGNGMTATVMSPDGTWSGAVGKAAGTRDISVTDQFSIASVTKTVIAAQVMQMVEAGALDLDDPATDHSPDDLEFDTNNATIRHLLSQRSGIKDYWPVVKERLSTRSVDRGRDWKLRDILQLVPAERSPAGGSFEYTDTNYVLLGLVIEQVRRQPVVDVLRDGVVDVDGTDRLIYQPDEKPTEPMAMPDGDSTGFEKGGGYLPFLASVSAGPPAAGMASDSPSLARWFRAFCAGELVSRDSVTKMATFQDGYGLGLYEPYTGFVGHTGEDIGYASWAGCLPDKGTVIVALTNHVVEDIGGMAAPLVNAALSD